MITDNLIYDAETEILQNIVRLANKDATFSATWQRDALKRIGTLRQLNLRVLSDLDMEKALKSDITDAAIDATKELDVLATQATGLKAIPIDADPAMKQIISAWNKTALDDFNLTNQRLLTGANKVYTNIVNKTAFKVLAGATDLQSALAQTCREWAMKGIPSIVDKAGRTWSTEAYSQMILRSTIRSVTTEVQFQRADEFGTDLIEISSHGGARPGCAPYQGRIFSRTGKNKKYPSLKATTYGEPSGLFGIQCKHSCYPYFEGVSKKTYKPNDTKENAKDYEESQVQRRYEREIRASKREVKVLSELGNTDTLKMAKHTLANRQANLKGFLEETGRTRRAGRELIYS